jgi:hypothetical protein
MTNDQKKRIKPLLKKLVMEVKNELREDGILPSTSVQKTAPELGDQVFKIGLNTIRFINGGLSIQNNKATIVFDDVQTAKLGQMIMRSRGK